MRILFVIAPSLCASHVGRLFAEYLAEQLNTHSSIAVQTTSKIDLDKLAAVECPHILHLFGSWDRQIIGIFKKAQQKLLPIVYSPTGGLLPWNKKHINNAQLLALRQEQTALLKKSNQIIALSQLEHSILVNAQIKNIQLWKNPIVTNTESINTVAENAVLLYQTTISEHQKQLEHKATQQTESVSSNAVIVNLCKQMLLIEYQYRQGRILDSQLAAFSQNMINSSYNEDEMNSVLRHMQKYEFFARLEYIMSQCHQLTEGFMPIPPLKDQQAETMLLNIEHA